METQHKEHPSALHLAALALGKLKAEAAVGVQSHLDDCGDCQSYLSGTSREELAEIIKRAKKAATDQNTMATGFSGTVASLKISQPGTAPREDRLEPLANPFAASAPASIQHSVSEGEIPHDLFAQSKYRILCVLGRGGMGTVYEGQHVRMDRRVAIKVINPELVDHPQALLRFEKEIQAVASLDHANIARAFDAEPIGSLQAFVMEFVRGQTLYDFLKARGRLSVVDASRSIGQSLRGLQHAHERQLVHRDLKPQNLMLSHDTGQIKILDFGLAKAVSENRHQQGLTHSRATMGTYAYMAPEQALDAAKADIRADIYSLGCTLYFLVSGVPPFVCESDTALLLAHQNQAPRPLKEICPEVPEALSDLVSRMLAKNPADRPQTPRDAADALLPFARAKSENSPPKATSASHSTFDGRGQSGWKPIVIAAVIMALVGLGAWATGLFAARTNHAMTIANPPGELVSAVGQRETGARFPLYSHWTGHRKNHDVTATVINTEGNIVVLEVRDLDSPARQFRCAVDHDDVTMLGNDAIGDAADGSPPNVASNIKIDGTISGGQLSLSGTQTWWNPKTRQIGRNLPFKMILHPDTTDAESLSETTQKLDDLVSTGSVWEGKRNYQKGAWEKKSETYFLHVSKREGATFSGQVFTGGSQKNEAEVEGRIAGSSIQWEERSGNKIVDVQGTMRDRGRIIQSTFHGSWSDRPATTTDGDGELSLDPKSIPVENK